ncbi:hypothetical protein BN77_p10148 [Rhizobium mesoamericanum STM3625]|uniref:Uncharacterized protein n=1 Tax=Rhizobium mesoamericanum STM3625 TaxID=1211777 RepID=K0Q273_9HYPH|nr:hypothetical protein BN77_p10148 [Rhizobium mesoamericanum STM3625]
MTTGRETTVLDEDDDAFALPKLLCVGHLMLDTRLRVMFLQVWLLLALAPARSSRRNFTESPGASILSPHSIDNETSA